MPDKGEAAARVGRQNTVSVQNEPGAKAASVSDKNF
jgi:hypothetical protein